MFRIRIRVPSKDGTRILAKKKTKRRVSFPRLPSGSSEKMMQLFCMYSMKIKLGCESHIRFSSQCRNSTSQRLSNGQEVRSMDFVLQHMPHSRHIRRCCCRRQGVLFRAAGAENRPDISENDSIALHYMYSKYELPSTLTWCMSFASDLASTTKQKRINERKKQMKIFFSCLCLVMCQAHGCFAATGPLFASIMLYESFHFRTSNFEKKPSPA